MTHQTVAFSIDTEKDRDLAHWLNTIGKGERSKAIRELLRVGLQRGGVGLGDIYQEIKELRRDLRSGVVLAAPDSGPGPSPGLNDFERENPDIVAALDNLGL